MELTDAQDKDAEDTEEEEDEEDEDAEKQEGDADSTRFDFCSWSEGDTETTEGTATDVCTGDRLGEGGITLIDNDEKADGDEEEDGEAQEGAAEACDIVTESDETEDSEAPFMVARADDEEGEEATPKPVLSALLSSAVMSVLSFPSSAGTSLLTTWCAWSCGVCMRCCASVHACCSASAVELSTDELSPSRCA